MFFQLIYLVGNIFQSVYSKMQTSLGLVRLSTRSSTELLRVLGLLDPAEILTVLLAHLALVLLLALLVTVGHHVAPFTLLGEFKGWIPYFDNCCALQNNLALSILPLGL